MKLYISFPSILVLVFVYLPIVASLIWRLWKKKTPSRIRKSLGILIIAITAYAIPLGDVTLHGLAMAKACPKAGLHVYKKVQAEGYYNTRSSGEEIRRFGFRFMETSRPGDKKITHYERQPDDSIATSFQDAITAEYAVIYDPTRLEEGVRKQRWWIRQRSDDEAVGEWLRFGAVPGWLDRVLVLRWFGDSSVGSCGQLKGDLIGYWHTEIISAKKID